MSIRLETRKGNVQRTAFLPLYREEIRLGSQPLAPSTASTASAGAAGSLAIDHLLEKADEAMLQQHLRGGALLAAGQALFDAAFGTDEASGRSVSSASSAPALQRRRRSPCASASSPKSPLLRRVPWALMAFRGDFLRDSGWTFAISADVDPLADGIWTCRRASCSSCPRSDGLRRHGVGVPP